MGYKLVLHLEIHVYRPLDKKHDSCSIRTLPNLRCIKTSSLTLLSCGN